MLALLSLLLGAFTASKSVPVPVPTVVVEIPEEKVVEILEEKVQPQETEEKNE